MRVNVYVDGFNLYHAIDNTGIHYWKWLNLRKLSEVFAPPPIYSINKIYYFSAYATWLSESFERHKLYVNALKTVEVTPILGRFKQKSRKCKICKNTYSTHEEKETDVNIASQMLSDSYKNLFDRAILITQDSDLKGPLKLIKKEFPEKQLRIVTPINLLHSGDLAEAVGKVNNKRFGCFSKIKDTHLDKCLFPETIISELFSNPIVRPNKYSQ